MMESPARGRLALSDGTVFKGRAFGAVGRGIIQPAEVVFNTSMTGYQEALTDPSYSGQILVMTAPLIGNTGVNSTDQESGNVQVSGFVVRELARNYSNFRAERSLQAFLEQANVLGLEGIDTRSLTRQLRVGGVVQGILTDDERLDDAALVSIAREAPSMSGQNLVKGVGCSNRSRWSQTLGDWRSIVAAECERPKRVWAIDCGAKRNILRHLASRNCDVEIVPHTITAEEISNAHSAGRLNGLFVSNGPGDPAAVNTTIDCLRGVIKAAAVPVFGICLGHQLLSLALGAKTYKLKFGHRGANQPVLNLLTNRVEITSQNHGFAVDQESLESVFGQTTHINLNDRTVAGFCLVDRPVFAVQHHPEASPGPHDAGYMFDAFVLAMETGRPLSFELLRELAAPGRQETDGIAVKRSEIGPTTGRRSASILG